MWNFQALGQCKMAPPVEQEPRIQYPQSGALCLALVSLVPYLGDALAVIGWKKDCWQLNIIHQGLVPLFPCHLSHLGLPLSWPWFCKRSKLKVDTGKTIEIVKIVVCTLRYYDLYGRNKTKRRRGFPFWRKYFFFNGCSFGRTMLISKPFFFFWKLQFDDVLKSFKIETFTALTRTKNKREIKLL